MEILTLDIIAYDKAQLNNTAVALGKFEGVHKGHMLLIDKITELAHFENTQKDIEKNNDNTIKSVVFTINMPDDKVINVDEERYAIFRDSGVDYVCECPFDDKISKLSPEEFIKNILINRLGASYVVVGEDFRFGYKRSGSVETLKYYAGTYNYNVVVFEKLKIDDKIISSTSIRQMLEGGYVDKICRYMGRNYSISGEVVYGKQLGRTIGFPTVNLIPQKRKMLPLAGAYETKVYIGDSSDGLRSITNVGSNPTVKETINKDNESEITVETHILDYSGVLYGSKIKVEFIRFLRPEIKFDGIKSLKEQLEHDKERVKNKI